MEWLGEGVECHYVGGIIPFRETILKCCSYAPGICIYTILNKTIFLNHVNKVITPVTIPLNSTQKRLKWNSFQPLLDGRITLVMFLLLCTSELTAVKKFLYEVHNSRIIKSIVFLR